MKEVNKIIAYFIIAAAVISSVIISANAFINHKTVQRQKMTSVYNTLDKTIQAYDKDGNIHHLKNGSSYELAKEGKTFMAFKADTFYVKDDGKIVKVMSENQTQKKDGYTFDLTFSIEDKQDVKAGCVRINVPDHVKYYDEHVKYNKKNMTVEGTLDQNEF